MSLEVLYDTETREVRAWCGDPEQFGNFKPTMNQKVIVLPFKVEDIEPGEDYMVDLDAKTVYPATPHVEPPDYKAMWRIATTPAKKLAVLGKMLKLEKNGGD